MNKVELMKTANEVRKGIIEAVHSAKSGHPGGSLSAADIYTYLYFEEMNVDPKDPNKADRDRFVLVQRTHSSRLLFCTGTERIFSGRRSEDIPSCRILSAGTSMYAAHTRCRYVFWFSGTGNLSCSRHGSFSKVVWMRTIVYTHSLEMERFRKDRYGRHLCLQAHKKLDNLVVIVDNNNLQIDGEITRG